MSLIENLQQEGMILVQQSASTWQEAVKLGIGCLVQAGKASWRYYDAILASVEKNGPYFVLMPGVVLPHARPEEGALGTGFSLVTLEKPIVFNSPENDPISILLSFCASDSASQVEGALVQAVSLFEDDATVNRLKEAQSSEQIITIINSLNLNEDE